MARWLGSGRGRLWRIGTVFVVTAVGIAAAYVTLIRPSDIPGPEYVRASLSNELIRVEWAAVEDADSYLIRHVDREFAVEPSRCAGARCATLIGPNLSGDSRFEVAAVVGETKSEFVSSQLVKLPRGKPSAESFDVIAWVDRGNGETIEIYPASSREEGERILRELQNDPQVIVAEIDSADVEYASAMSGARSHTREGTPWSESTLELEKAHRSAKGEGVVVAVIDDGVWAGHPALRGRVAPGVRVSSLRSGAPSSGTNDPTSHATAVAGVIASSGTSDAPLGVAPRATILPVDARDEDGNLTVKGIAHGVVWATDNGADVINISLATPQNSQALSKALAYARSRGVVVVAGTGNWATKQGCPKLTRWPHNTALYPAANRDAIAVGAFSRDGNVWRCSQSGTYVDLVAPGVDLQLLGGSKGELYFDDSGTSFSSPAVAGVAALILAVDDDFAARDVTQILYESARPLPGNRDGRGVISAASAVRVAKEWSMYRRNNVYSVGVRVTSRIRSMEFRGAISVSPDGHFAGRLSTAATPIVASCPPRTIAVGGLTAQITVTGKRQRERFSFESLRGTSDVTDARQANALCQLRLDVVREDVKREVAATLASPGSDWFHENVPVGSSATRQLSDGRAVTTVIVKGRCSPSPCPLIP